MRTKEKQKNKAEARGFRFLFVQDDDVCLFLNRFLHVLEEENEKHRISIQNGFDSNERRKIT